MNSTTNVSLEILFLNDLLNKKVIDKDIYDKAVKKITGINKVNETTTLASA